MKTQVYVNKSMVLMQRQIHGAGVSEDFGLLKYRSIYISKCKHITNQQKFICKENKTNIGSKSIKITGATQYNSLPPHIK